MVYEQCPSDVPAVSLCDVSVVSLCGVLVWRPGGVGCTPSYFKSFQLGVSISNNRRTAASGQDHPQQIWPKFEKFGVPVMFRWCPGGVPTVSR
jgi:hypothetical protein